jgi:hypothetical protein
MSGCDPADEMRRCAKTRDAMSASVASNGHIKRNHCALCFEPPPPGTCSLLLTCRRREALQCQQRNPGLPR